MRALTGVLIFLWVAALLAAAGYYQYQEQALLAPMPLAGIQEFEVSSGATLPHVAQQLATRGLLKDPSFLVLYARLGRVANQLKAGRYQLTPGMSAWQALLRFNRGEVIQRAFTIVEGWRFQDLLAALRQSDAVQWTLEGKSEAAIMRSLGRPNMSPEGLFYADTYHFPDGTTDQQLLKRAMLTLDHKLAMAWTRRAANLPLKNSYQALILASIIEKETALAEERPRIAGVFIRRLRKGMRLQTDPTVIYGLGAAFDGNLRRRDLRADTPYNTYTRKGLPPTPIAMAGAGAIRAALHPDSGKELYFVARGDGRHYFSRTYQEHLRAVNQYQRRARSKIQKTRPNTAEN